MNLRKEVYTSQRQYQWRCGWDSNPRTLVGIAGFQDQSLKPLSHHIIKMVGMTGFEPATSCSQSTHSAKLSYIPIKGGHDVAQTPCPKGGSEASFEASMKKKMELTQGFEP